MKRIVKTLALILVVLVLAVPAFAQIGYEAPPMDDAQVNGNESSARVTVTLYEYEKDAEGNFVAFNSEDGILANEDLRFAVEVTLPSQEGSYCDLQNPCRIESVVNNAAYAPVLDAENSEIGETELKFNATSADGIFAAEFEYSTELVEKGGTFTYMFTTKALTASTVTVNATLSGGRKELPMRFAYDNKVFDIEGVEKENFTVYVDNSYGMVISVDSESKVTGLEIFSATQSNKFFDVVYNDGVEFKGESETIKKGDNGYTKLYEEYETIMNVLGFSEGEMAYVYTNALVNRFNTAFSLSASSTFDKAGSVPPPFTSGNSVVLGFVVMAAAISLSAAFFMKKLRKV